MEPVAIWKRAPVAFAIVLLVVGAAVGFGVGYKVGDNGGKATVKVTSPRTTPRNKKLTPAQVKQVKRNQLLACLANHGVKYPKGSAAQVSKPPAGVSQAKYSAAVGACFVAKPSPNTRTTVRAP